MMQMHQQIAIAVLVSTLGSFAYAQKPEKLSFDVASIKPAAPPEGGRILITPRRGGPGTADPGRITWNNVSLFDLILNAYDVKRYQLSGPDWISAERYDVAVTVREGATNDQVRVMWQNLLADRWGVVVHRDSKVFQLDELVVGKGGAKLKETDLDPSATPAPGEPLPLPPPGPPKLDKSGVPQLASPALVMMMMMGPNGPSARMVGKAQTMEQLANGVANQLNHPVVDKTGLTGKYDFTLEFAPDPSIFKGIAGMMMPPPGAPPPGAEAHAPDDPSGLNLAGALQQQLGLRLQSAKGPLDVIVVDKANKTPTEN